MRVLLVDDDPGISEVVAQYLRLSASHTVVPTLSAREALDVINEADEPFDLFLIDIQMPGVDGVTLVQMVREHAKYANTPIVMLTAMHEKRYLDDAFAAGATDYVPKPFDLKDLTKRLDAAYELTFKRVDSRDAQDGTRDGGRSTENAGANKDAALSPTHGKNAVVAFGEFQNYLHQLKSRRLFAMPVIAIGICAENELQARLSPEDFERLIRDVADVTQDTLLNLGGILTYQGRGVFLCVPKGRVKGHRRAVQKALNKAFLLAHPSNREKVNLMVGDQVRLSDGASVAETLNRALASLENRDFGAQEIGNVKSNFLKRQRLLGDRAPLVRRGT